MLLLALPALAADPSDLVGTWRFEVAFGTEVMLPIAGPSMVETHQIRVATISRSGGTLQLSEALCRMFATTESRLTAARFPPGFLRAVGDQTYPLTVQTRPDGTVGVRGRAAPATIGWDPHTSGGVLPEGPGDRGVVDGDGDGHPGATLLLSPPVFGDVQVYIAQTSATVLEGTRTTPDHVEGRALMEGFVQHTLGASNPLFTLDLQVRVDNDRGWFTLDRVPGGTTCTTLDDAA